MSSTDRNRTRRSGDGIVNSRGQTEVVGVVLLVAIVLLGSTVVLLAGQHGIEQDRRQVALGQAENAMLALDDRASTAAFGFENGSQVVDVDVPGDDRTFTVDGDSWLRIELLNPNTGAPSATVLDEPLGTVVYRNDGTTVGYEGGGVWRSEGNGSVMLTPPEFDFTRDTMSVPVVSVSGDAALNDRVVASRAAPPRRAFPNASRNLTNRIQQAKVVVTVHSEYYQAWGRYFERTTPGIVLYDHGAETVSVKLLAVPTRVYLRAGIVATSGAGELELAGTGAYTDSYDSDFGNYSTTVSNNGTVEAVGDLSMGGNSTIKGNLRSGGTVSFSGGPTVLGNVSWTDEPAPSPGDVEGEDDITRIDGVATIEPIDAYVRTAVDTIEQNNNNSDIAGLLDDDRLVLDSGESATIDSGVYYLDSLYLDGGDLTVDTTDGDVKIAVRDWMVLERNGGDPANLTVRGDGTVRFLVASRTTKRVQVTGEGHRDVNFHVGKGCSVYVPHQRAPGVRIFAPKTFEATITGSTSARASMTGIIYAPSGQALAGSTYTKQSNVFGGIVTGELRIGQYGAVHYDKALGNLGLPRLPTAARLEYMHVTVHEVTVDDG